MAGVKKIIAREVLDSRGLPSIEARLFLDSGEMFSAFSTSGESLGKYEGVELRDGDMARYGGMGVTKAVSYINDVIGPKLKGADPLGQSGVDDWLVSADGTENVSKLGVNTTMTVSQLFIKAGAFAARMPVYSYIGELYSRATQKKAPTYKVPSIIVNLINGGKHGTKNLEFQEFHVIPSTSYPFNQALEITTTIYQALEKTLDYRNAGTAVSDEGGFVPNLLTNVDALEVIRETLSSQKYRLGLDVYIGLDCAASQFHSGGSYKVKDKSTPLNTANYIDFMAGICHDYPILIAEDPIEQEDFDAWAKLNEKVGSTIYIAGDDFIAGKTDRLAKAIEKRAATALVIKFNQQATITQMLLFMSEASASGMRLIFSQRLAESNDAIIADFAVGTSCEFVKFGAPVRGERVAKYNRLLEIERELQV